MRRGGGAPASATPVERHEPPPVPAELGRAHTGTGSTQQALGRLFVDLAHEAPEVAAHVVTVAPDVASSTNLGGWINRGGHLEPRRAHRLVRRRLRHARALARVRPRPPRRARHRRGQPRRPAGRARARRGARDGQPLLPVGTIYDPFVTRAHEPWSFGIYAGGQSILVGTPSGITLGPEGGAHQSVITPSVGIEQPGCVAWEPAFAQDFEWSFLHALGRLGRDGRQLGLLPPVDAAARPGAGRGAARGRGARAAPAPTCWPAATGLRDGRRA